MSRNLSALSFRKGLKYNLFDEYGKRAGGTGTVSPEELEKLADEFLIGKANTYGAATFYDFLKPENRGKKVYVCNGSACLAAGTQPGLKKELRKHFEDAEIGHMCCLGRCHENAAFQFEGNNYSARSTEDIHGIVGHKFADCPDHYDLTTSGTAVLSAGFPGFEKYTELLKALLNTDGEKALVEIIGSGLRGRGGAGFPTGLKLEACKNQESDVKFVVCNADEGDPGAYTDRFLLEQRPHSVLFGMLISGIIAGAQAAVVYIRGEYPESIRAIQKTVDEFRENGLCGENIHGSSFNFEFRVIGAQGAYICGEETSLLASIEGQRPEVRVRPPFPAQQGLFRKPTMLSNVETFACLPYILENGGHAYSRIGKGRSTGTKLLSLDGFFNKPGVYEVDMGTPLKEVVYQLAGGFKSPVKALHIGGPLGGLVPVTKIEDLTVDFESFSENGFLLGHASVICIPQDFALVKYLEHLFEFTADESCGKCFPCRLGSVRGMEMLQKAQHEDYHIDRNLFIDLLETLEKGSLCALGGGVPLPVRNALEHFADELDDFFVN